VDGAQVGAKTIPLIIFLTNFEECKFAPQTLKPLKNIKTTKNLSNR
jgi:hypothetical protein